MLVTLASDLGLFVLMVFGLGQPAAAWWNRWRPLERLTLALAVALVAIYLFSFGLYAAGLDPRWHWLLPLAAVAGLAARARATWALLRTPEIAGALGSWLLVAAWCLSLLALIYSYSGGGWMGDWQEHYERARFFLGHWSRDFLFVGFYPLTARPPLANLVTGSFLVLTDDRLAQFQVFTTLLNTLVFFPALLFVRRWGGGRAASALLALVLMLNPLFAQNTTFAWTKLIAAFFVVAGLYFLATEGDRPERAPGWPGLPLLAAGLLTHYSAGPWMLVFVPLWLWQARARLGFARLGRTIWPAVLASAALLATWFGWALAQYGLRGTVGTNTTVRGLGAASLVDNFNAWLVKLWCTLIPHPFHWVNPEMTAQTNRLTWLRDYFFDIYQVNLPLAFGSAGLFVLLLAARQAKMGAVFTTPRIFWSLGIPLVVGVSVAAQGDPDLFGVTHICLQPLVIIGLAFVAAWLGRPRPPGRTSAVVLILALLWAVDLALGLALHFAGQAYMLGWQPGMDLNQYALSLNILALINLAAKLNLHQGFLRDLLPFTPHQVAALAGLILAATLGLALRAVRSAGAAATPGAK